MRKPILLICDDDEGILDMLTLLLKKYGFQIIPEKNSLNVMYLVENKKPDLLILDLWMPYLSGDRILAAVRSNAAIARLPVLVISASIDGANIAQQAGANAFVSKPFQVTELLDKIEACLQVGQL